MRRNIALDDKDRQLLGLLRQDARMATAALVSAKPCRNPPASPTPVSRHAIGVGVTKVNHPAA
jgi:DNA-binding Lrp family transcriptional regulator